MIPSRSIRTASAARRVLASSSAALLCHPSTSSASLFLHVASSSSSASISRRLFSVTSSPSPAAKVNSPSPGATKERVPSNKVYDTPKEALEASGLKDGMTLLVGGFGLCGVPQATIDAVRDSKVKSQRRTCTLAHTPHPRQALRRA